jgi:hypothetical protein
MRSLPELLDYITRSRNDMVRVYAGDDYPVVAAPATSEAIAQAETHVDMRFPPSYREFLLVSNGIRDFADEIDLISVEEIIHDDYADVIQEICDIGWRMGQRLLVEGLIIGCRPGHGNIFIIDRSVEPDDRGELPVVYWDDIELLRAASFHEFLEEWCVVSDQLLTDAREKARLMPPGGPMRVRPPEG